MHYAFTYVLLVLQCIHSIGGRPWSREIPIRNACRLVEYYKTRCGQQNVIIDRTKNEIEAVKELKRCVVGVRVHGNLDTDMHYGDGEPPVREPVSLIWSVTPSRHAE